MQKKKRGRTAYSDEFRREAVRLVESGRGDVVQVAKDLGVHPETLRIWCRTVARQRAGASTPARVLLEEENRRLRQENARLEEERDILKNCLARRAALSVELKLPEVLWGRRVTWPSAYWCSLRAR